MRIEIIGFILIGVTMEVFRTALIDYATTGDRRLRGETYLWMFPIYAVIPFVYMLILAWLPDSSIWIRGLWYMIAFYVVEFVGGIGIKHLIGRCPRDYTKHTLSIAGRTYTMHLRGIVTLYFIPIWYLYGVIGEWYFLFLSSI